MSKKSLISIIFIAAILAGAVFVLANRKATAPQEASGGQQIETNATPSSQTGGVYVEYSPNVLAEASGQRVLFFFAPWCPQCQAIDADIKREGVPAGFTIIKTDYDSNRKLRQKYGVTLQTAFVKVDAAGNKIGDVYVAYNEPSLDAVKRDFLNL